VCTKLDVYVFIAIVILLEIIPVSRYYLSQQKLASLQSLVAVGFFILLNLLEIIALFYSLPLTELFYDVT
jgi:hypothetical protein